jgi:hypothetical protein
MNERPGPATPFPIAPSAQWLDGYAAALQDALAIVETMGGPSFSNLSAPVLLRLKTRLIELEGRTRAA